MCHALFIGLTTLDVAHVVADFPRPNQKIVAKKQLLCPGGPATNAAVTFAALASQVGEKAHTTLLSAVGRGPLADFIAADLVGAQVNVLDAVQLPTRTETAIEKGKSRLEDFAPTVSAVAISAKTGERCVSSANSRFPIDFARADELLTTVEGEHGRPDLIFLDGHNAQLASWALRRYRPDKKLEMPTVAGPVTMLDGGSWKPAFTELLPNIDIAVVSADFQPPGTKTWPEMFDFLRQTGVQRIIRTDGAQKIHWWWEDETGSWHPPHVKARDTWGAGDVFHGAFAWYFWWQLRQMRNLQPGTLPHPKLAVANAAQLSSQTVTEFGPRAALTKLSLGGGTAELWEDQ